MRAALSTAEAKASAEARAHDGGASSKVGRGERHLWLAGCKSAHLVNGLDDNPMRWIISGRSDSGGIGRTRRPKIGREKGTAGVLTVQERAGPENSSNCKLLRLVREGVVRAQRKVVGWVIITRKPQPLASDMMMPLCVSHDM